MTAPEIIYNKASSKKENMGLTTWKNALDRRTYYILQRKTLIVSCRGKWNEKESNR